MSACGFLLRFTQSRTHFCLATFQCALFSSRKLVVPQTVAGKRRIHDDKVHRIRVRGAAVINLINQRTSESDLPTEQFKRAQVRPPVKDPQPGLEQPHPPEGRLGAQHPERARRHVRRGEVDVVSPEHVLDEVQGEQGLVLLVRGAGRSAQLVNPFRCRHQQRPGAAGRIADAQLRDLVDVRPIAVLFADRQGGQQGRRRGAGVEGSVVARRVEHFVEDPPQQIVPQAVRGPGHLLDLPRQHVDGQVRPLRSAQCVQGGQGRLEDRPIVDQENRPPSLAEPADRVVGIRGALAEIGRRPCSVFRLVPLVRRVCGQVLVDALVEQHRHRQHQHPALGRGEVLGRLLPAVLGQVQAVGERPALRRTERCNGMIQGVRKLLRGFVRISHAPGRAAQRFGQLRNAPRLPVLIVRRLAGRPCLARSQSPVQIRVRDIALVRIRRIAEREAEHCQPLPEPPIDGLDGLLPLAPPLRLDHDLQAVDLDQHVQRLRAALILADRGQAQIAEEPSQLDVELVFQLRHAAPLACLL